MAKLSDFFSNGVPTGSSFKPMTPPITVNGDVITIDDFVYGVKVRKTVVNTEKGWFIITFEDEKGDVSDKILSFPEESWSSKRKEMAFRQLFTLGFLFGVMKELEAQLQDEEHPYEVFAQTLGLLIEGKGGEDIVLKLVFKDSTGMEEKYVIANNNWISSKYQMEQDAKNPDAKYKNGVMWIEGEYADKRKFTKVEKVPDNLTPQTPAPSLPPNFDLSALNNL